MLAKILATSFTWHAWNQVLQLDTTVAFLTDFLRLGCFFLVEKGLERGLIVHFAHKIVERGLALNCLLRLARVVLLVEGGTWLILLMEGLAHLERLLTIHVQCVVQRAFYLVL